MASLHVPLSWKWWSIFYVAQHYFVIQRPSSPRPLPSSFNKIPIFSHHLWRIYTGWQSNAFWAASGCEGLRVETRGNKWSPTPFNALYERLGSFQQARVLNKGVTRVALIFSSLFFSFLSDSFEIPSSSLIRWQLLWSIYLQLCTGHTTYYNTTFFDSGLKDHVSEWKSAMSLLVTLKIYKRPPAATACRWNLSLSLGMMFQKDRRTHSLCTRSWTTFISTDKAGWFSGPPPPMLF